MENEKKGKKKKNLKREGFVFCIIATVLLIGQWIVFYVYSRANSVLTSFQVYVGDQKYEFLPLNDLFRNYKYFFKDIANSQTLPYILNGYKFWFANWIIGQFALFIAFYFYKKYPLSGAMMLVMMIPSALAGATQPNLFRYFAIEAVPEIGRLTGIELFQKSLLHASRPEVSLGTTIFSSMFFAFPGAMLFYTAQYNKIPKELVEAAQLDGITFFGEFVHIAFPSVYSVWSLGNLSILTAGLMTTGPGFSMFQERGYQYGVVTFGYDLQMKILGKVPVDADRYPLRRTLDIYPYSAAVNMFMAILTILGVQLMKKIFEKLDPYREKDL